MFLFNNQIQLSTTHKFSLQVRVRQLHVMISPDIDSDRMEIIPKHHVSSWYTLKSTRMLVRSPWEL